MHKIFVILIILIFIYIYKYCKNYNDTQYNKFEYNLLDTKKLPKEFYQNPYYKSDFIDSDIKLFGNIQNTCKKKCNDDHNCLGFFLWNNNDNSLSSCNMIKCNNDSNNCNPDKLKEFYENSKNMPYMGKWDNSYTYIKKMN